MKSITDGSSGTTTKTCFSSSRLGRKSSLLLFLLLCLLVKWFQCYSLQKYTLNQLKNGAGLSGKARNAELIQEVLMYESNIDASDDQGNDRSLLRTEVMNITHYPSESKIVVNFHNHNGQERKCRNPRIIGRLSGKYLAIIRWDHDAKVKDELSLPHLERFPGNTAIAVETSDADESKRDHRSIEKQSPIVKLQSFDDTTITDSITGYYQVPEPGRYFVEIIGQLCNDFPFKTDFNSLCIEDPDYFRITAKLSYIDVVKYGMNDMDAKIMAKTHANPLANIEKDRDGDKKNENDGIARKLGNMERDRNLMSSSPTSSSSLPIGFWTWTNETHDPVPLYTRYQRSDCRGTKEYEPRCIETSSLDRFSPYKFQFLGSPDVNIKTNMKYNNNLQFLQRHHQVFDQTTGIEHTTDKITKDISNDRVKICVAGYSHARDLAHHFLEIIKEFNTTNSNLNNVEVGRITLRYPMGMDAGRAQEIIRNGCNVTVVSLVQWSAGRKQQGPHIPAATLPQYKQQLKAGIQKWQWWNVSFAFRTPHYNAVGDLYHQCPARDKRWPVVIDGYNDIIKALAVELDVKYIDTGDIMDAMWDSPADYQHYRAEVGRVEAIYILRQSLRYVYKK